MAEQHVLVIGVALIRHGRVLAARRSRPAALAGRWELPGGKVEPGEDAGAAAVREMQEELGCRIEVTGILPGEQPIGTGHTLRVALAELAAGEPTPTEHDAVRWLAAEQLLDVQWLAPDVPFLAAVRRILSDGERLPGGNVGGAVRVGRTVRRPTGRWTPAVHRLLHHLEQQGLDCVPRVLGLDSRGREVLTYLEGQVVDVDNDALSDAQLGELAGWTRRFHDAVLSFHEPGPWRFPGVAAADLVAHQDLAPYNACFSGDRLTGVFDWDLAGPSTTLLELALLAWTGVPLFRPVDAAVAARRLRIIAERYGGPAAAEILAAVPERVEMAIRGIRGSIATGDERMARLRELGEPERSEQLLAEHLSRSALIDAKLSRHREHDRSAP